MRPRLVQDVEQTRIEPFQIAGGENLTAAPLSIRPGELIASQNYECIDPQGVRRIDGYERFDGRPAPSDASYWKLSFVGRGSNAIVVGDTVTGVTSSASGEVLVVTLTSGSWASSNAVGYLILFNVSGTFQDGENLQVSGTNKAEADGPAYERGADNDTDDDTWLQAAIEATRADIQTVPGSGAILGVWAYSGTKYAFRTNAGGTAAVMHKSSASGWTAVSLGYELDFTSGGTTEIVAGNTITGATSGATATVGRVILTSGAWAGGDAAGRFILTSQTGTFQSENLNVGASLNLATIAGNSSAITLAPSGRYEFVNHNFYGSTATLRMYGCDGVNRAFEFDGTVFTPIDTGMTTDTPDHIYAHKKHLFLSFAGGSVQHSSIGKPIEFSAITGAAELAIGEEITGFHGVPDALAIFGRNKISILYGSGSDDWNLSTHSEAAGAIEWTIQSVGRPIYLDDPGLTNLEAVQAFGNFADNAFSEKISPLVDAKKALACASVTVRQKSQYRIFFTDNSGIICTFNKGKVVGFTRIDYGKAVRCACSVEDSGGNEVLLFGSDDGYVYQMDSGTSFDGSAITAFVRLPFYHYGNPRQKKRFRKIFMDIDAPGGADLSFAPDFDYGGTGMPQGNELSLDVLSGGGYWDENAYWESFIWDAQVVGTAEGYIDGTGVNMSLSIRSVATYEEPHTLYGAVIHYSPRGLAR